MQAALAYIMHKIRPKIKGEMKHKEHFKSHNSVSVSIVLLVLNTKIYCETYLDHNQACSNIFEPMLDDL